MSLTLTLTLTPSISRIPAPTLSLSLILSRSLSLRGHVVGKNALRIARQGLRATVIIAEPTAPPPPSLSLSWLLELIHPLPLLA